MKIINWLRRIKGKQADCDSVDQLRARGVKVGENVNLYNTTIDFTHGFLISIGDNVTLTGVRILAHDASTQIPLGYTKVGKVSIGNNVFAGVGSIILPGVDIGNNVVIGAGTVVSKNVPSNTVVAGNPMQIIEGYSEFTAKHRERLKTCPVYHTLWNEKTDKEKEQMKKELESTIGYDL